MRFGETLVSAKVVSQENVEEALSTQRYKKVRLGRLLRDLGVITQNDLNKHLTAFLKPNTLDSISGAAEKIKERNFHAGVLDWCSKQGAIPFAVDASQVTLISP